jgi:hypothetical protein
VQHFCTLTGDELKNYVNLEWIVVLMNPIDFVNFSTNKITKVGSDLLTGLDHLIFVSFDPSVCNLDRATNRKEVVAMIEKMKEPCPEKRKIRQKH